MQFKDIPGQQAIKSYFLDISKAGKIPHAMLITGNPGTGKLPLALAFASFVQCQNKTETDSCGTCPSCQKANKIIHPDIHFSFPVVAIKNKPRKDTTSKDYMTPWRSIIIDNPFFSYNDWLQHIQASNSQGDINKKECVEIIQKLSLNSFESKQKFLIIWMSELLGNNGNVLLKLIEEPPSDTFIILIADNPNLVLNTIKSRCQLVRTSPFSDSEISDYLSNQYGEKDWTNVIRLANGNIQKAIDLQHGLSNNFAEDLINWLRIAYVSDPIKINKWVIEIDKKGKDNIFNFLEYSIHFFRAYHRSSYLPPEKISLTTEELGYIEKMRKIIQFEQLVEIVDLISDSYNNIKRNANSKIVLANLCLNLEKAMKRKKI